ncbi:hypothetical protein GGR16_002075 [Chelatococcus caeni]|uniref:Uncharacterized protein n=1 Tax=Chelatococcus caeni TaxID=1348468 RepID=A0A840C268_9HYPH|nr:hypothetical protein [Chelatococcus caeni]MBB4017046.1 hypothetical protein [Chelatococcus caeni]
MTAAPKMTTQRMWTEQDRVYAAYLAGTGATPAEIAALVGGTSAAYVGQVLRSFGLLNLRRPGRPNEDILTLRWKRSDRQRLNDIADRLDRDPEELLALIGRRVLDGGVDAVNALVDRFDTVG